MGNSAKSRSIGRVILQLALACLLIVGVLELVAGVLLFLECFVGDKFGAFDNIIGWIIMIVWAIAIVVGDVLKGNFNDFLPWLYGFAGHIIVLGALWSLND